MAMNATHNTRTDEEVGVRDGDCLPLRDDKG